MPRENYASGFGLQWLKHARTQYDSESGLNITGERFFRETRWPRKMSGERILEVGSGSGRFTEQAASTGALVVSMDYSYAVEANFQSNGAYDNVLIVQADIYAMPFRHHYFDRCFCFGVLQHTPDVHRSFLALPPYLKPGGKLAADVYKTPPFWKRWFYTKYLVRPFVKNIAPGRLYALCQKYIQLLWPLSRLIHRLPYGRQLNWMLLIADYRDVYALSDEQLKDWALLDTFDMLSPAYDSPQTLETFTAWFQEANLTEIDVHYGYNGIEGRATKPR